MNPNATDDMLHAGVAVVAAHKRYNEARREYQAAACRCAGAQVALDGRRATLLDTLSNMEKAWTV